MSVLLAAHAIRLCNDNGSRRSSCTASPLLQRCAGLALDLTLAVGALVALLIPVMIFYGRSGTADDFSFAHDLPPAALKVFISAILGLCVRPLFRCEQKQQQGRQPRTHQRSDHTRRRGGCVVVVLVLVLVLFCTPARAVSSMGQYIIPVKAADGGVISVPVILKVIMGVIGAIFNIFSAIWSAFVWGLAISKYLACWFTALMILVYIVLQLLEFYNLVISWSIFRLIDKLFQEALDCVPIQPEYGPYRKEDFRKGQDPKQQPTSFFDLRKRSLSRRSTGSLYLIDDHGDVVYPSTEHQEHHKRPSQKNETVLNGS
jgi:hypothetical protein